MEERYSIKFDLTLFSDGAGDKTEEATPRKKEKAREEGQVAKSVEVTTTFLLTAIFFSLKFIGPFIANKIISLFHLSFNLMDTKEIDIRTATAIFNDYFLAFVICVLPFFLISYFVAFISNAMQVGFKLSFKPLKPKLDKLNPISGFKRIFSMKTIVELIKSLAKIAIILAIVYFTVKDYDTLFFRFYELSFIQAYMIMFDLAITVGMKIGLFFLFVAGADYMYQRFSLAKKLRMTKQEVKDEYKMVEGNPEIKQKIRQRMREASMRRMMQDLKDADVVITNPTHFAVAIRYKDGEDMVPVVVAKGVDIIAMKIKEKSKDYEIEIVEDRPLARALYYTVEIGDFVPESLYEAVARVLALVYSLNKNKGL